MGQYILFAYSIAVVLDTLGFYIETVFYCSNFELRLNDFNFFVMGKEYVSSLLSVILVLSIVIKVVKVI